jgi:hypothetical protein
MFHFSVTLFYPMVLSLNQLSLVIISYPWLPCIKLGTCYGLVEWKSMEKTTMSSTPGHLWPNSLWPSSQPFSLSQSILASQGRRWYTPQQRQRLALARTRAPKTCQDTPARALTALWPRQYVEHSIDAVLLLHPYHHVEHLLPALYTLDKLPGLPLLRRRRPRRLSAARPVTDIGRARALPSPFSLSQYRLSIARTSASRSRPRLALSLATGAAPWPFLLSTPRPPLDPINRGDRLLPSAHNPLPSPH